MNTVKETMIQLINEQPDDSTYEEILEELGLRAMVLRGLEDHDAGRVISHEDLKKEITNW